MSPEMGSFQVWKTKIPLLGRRKACVYLHAINDSKPVYRISTKYAAQPLVPITMTILDNQKNCKVHKEVKTAEAH